MNDENARDFIRERIAHDHREGLVDKQIVTRFPPEPNGFLHLGHAKSICLNFGVAQEFGGVTYLRFDDTNPLNESVEYVEAIKSDVKWLGFDWEDRLTFASDYFAELYGFAEQLINRGKAYVCDLSFEELQATRGTLTEPGIDSPYRNRPVEENRELFGRMRGGEFPNGSRTLRAKIDMQSPNINLRDPVLYRIIHAHHHRTGDEWCIYPMYDFTHCLCDALEGITHSLCTLEFEDHRPLYDWVLDSVNVNFHPPQIEFSRLGLEYQLMSKRVLNQLVEQGIVLGWDDPRMPTLAGLRRKGVPPSSIRQFCQRVGVTKQANYVAPELLDYCVRNDLEKDSRRVMAVRNPIKVEITNFEGENLELEAPWHPKNPEWGTRKLGFGRYIYIDASDFSDDPPPKFKRLVPGGVVRLRYAFIIRCDEVVKDESGDVVLIRAHYFPDSRSGQDTSGIRPKGVIQFVSQANAVEIELRDYEKLFNVRIPGKGELKDELNENSMTRYSGALEQAAVDADFKIYQFERLGFYRRDRDLEKQMGTLVFHRAVSLHQRWKPS